jgi:acid phosphatase
MLSAMSAVVLLVVTSAPAVVLQPDHVVVVVMQDRFSNAIGNPLFDYVNGLVPTSLVYTNSHGVTHPSEPNSLALYSGSTQGVTDNGRNYVFDPDTPNLGNALTAAHFSFAGYTENLPGDGAQDSQAGDGTIPDLYTRNVNPMAQFTDVDGDGDPVSNPEFNQMFSRFQERAGDYEHLPTVSFVIPNAFHSTHGSNEGYPAAGAPDDPDPENNNLLRDWADDWLAAEINPYLLWAREHNSLLIITQDEEQNVGGSADTITTLVAGDPALFVTGINGNYYNHYNLLHTLTDMYGLDPLGESAEVAPLATNSIGQLTVPEPSSVTLLVCATGLAMRRRSRGKKV